MACLLAALGALAAGPAAAIPVPDVLDADDPTIADDLLFADLDLTQTIEIDEDVVLAAQKVRTTVQDAPSIITVVTRRQIAERGYRTLNDVLRTVAGFEGDRWEANGWHKEAFARGLPRTVLVLVNGVNIIEPVRNFVNLDRKIPLETVDRIEVTSGPGGVLWGSNALLGVVNIVTRGPDDSGAHAVAGFGDGPGDRRQLKLGAGYSHAFTEDIGLFTHLDLYSTDGPDLRVETQKLVGALPEPAPDSATFYLPSRNTSSAGQRSWFFNWSGRLELGDFALDWMVPWEDEYRSLATGGAVMVEDYLRGETTGRPTRGVDPIRLVNLSYARRFAGGKWGLKARTYFVSWHIEEDPFGAFPASPLLFASNGNTRDLHVDMRADRVIRPGAAVDVDVRLTPQWRLLFGAEGFLDQVRGLTQASWSPLVDGACPQGFSYDADDPYLPCKIRETLVEDTDRVIGAGFAAAEWRPVGPLALNAGLRLQLSDSYSPTFLYNGGLVWELAPWTHLKLFTANGLRPPSFTSTHVLPTRSSISFQRNPDLEVETSRSYEVEVNTMVLRDVGPLRDLYLRGNGAITLMDNVIGRPAGVFANSGKRQIRTAEALARLRFSAGHEVWANYTFTQVLDDDFPGGELRNFSRHMGTFGGKLSLLEDHIELDAMLTLKGKMDDPNRPAVVDPSMQYSVSCAQLAAMPPSADPLLGRLQATCSLPGLSGGLWVLPGQRTVETIRALALLDVGVRFKNIWRDLTASIFVYNLLDHRYYEPDFFNDPRLMSRPQPKPGLSIFGSVSVGL